MFLYELEGHGYHFKNNDWHDDWERFEDDMLNMAWEMWCASASRKGYKLVPVEPTYEMIDAAIGNNGHIESIYRDMIGAAP